MYPRRNYCIMEKSKIMSKKKKKLNQNQQPPKGTKAPKTQPAGGWTETDNKYWIKFFADIGVPIGPCGEPLGI